MSASKSTSPHGVVARAEPRGLPVTNTGLISASDRQIARRIAALAETTPEVELALQLVLRGLRLGHVCLELDGLRERLEFGRSQEADGPAIPWPAPRDWRAALAASPLVAEVGAEASALPARPLVLDGPRLYLRRMYDYERRLERAIQARADAPLRPVPAQARAVLRDALTRLFGAGLRDAETPPPLDRQRLAALVAVTRPLTIIAGGPGTGKTTTVKKLLLLMLAWAEARHGDELSRWPSIALAAPTGKAAARLRESLTEGLEALSPSPPARARLEQLEAMTVHRLLGPRPGSRSRFRHDRDHRLGYDIVIVDEASMIPLSMMTKLFEAVRSDAQLILLGDRNQLASVEAGAVLGDLCGPRPDSLEFSRETRDALVALDPSLDAALAQDDSLRIQDQRGIWDGLITLDKVHRFDEASGIGQLARALQRPVGGPKAALEILESGGLRGRFPDLERLDSPRPGSPALARLEAIAVEGYAPLLRAALSGADPAQVLAEIDRLRILCAHRRGPQGSLALGARVERWLEAAVPGYETRAAWPIGRPLLVVENDHEQQLYNGDVGVVLRHPREPQRRVVAFPDPRETSGVRLVSPSRLPRHETVFTMSIHKSQGSQFEHAVVVMPGRSSRICTLELVYTGITRARRRLTLASDEGVLRDALGRRVQRASGLRARLW